MKIITVTSHRAYNYGAVLQAYALHKVLSSIKYENELLDYYNYPDTDPSRIKAKRHPKVMLRAFLLNSFALFHMKETKRFKSGFHEFVEKYLKMTKRYPSLEDLQNNPPAADLYLTGSDQVFALGGSLMPLRFLEFGNPKAKVSYAASLGSYQASEKDCKYYIERLAGFAKISIREKQGAQYLNKITGYECESHIDPVFLLSKDEWSAFSSPSQVEEKYILCYPMLGNVQFQFVVDKLKDQLKLPVVVLLNKPLKTVKGDTYIYGASPREFLGLIKNASAIVTTSFHATAFSIIFEKPIFSIVGLYKPERVTNLYELFGLEKRLITHDSNFLPPIDMDYENIKKIIETEKDKAIRYLSSLGELI